MKIIGQRIIEYLRADTDLVTLLGSANQIVARGLNEPDQRASKTVYVECSLGQDLNYADGQNDEFEIEVVVSRKIENAFSSLMDLVESVDELLNKAEVALSNDEWSVLNIVRADTPSKGVLIDVEANEYYFILRYSYILDET
jgi:predicted AlkP superfamily pyrophosphatase or phosphodiesterase